MYIYVPVRTCHPEALKKMKKGFEKELPIKRTELNLFSLKRIAREELCTQKKNIKKSLTALIV